MWKRLCLLVCLGPFLALAAGEDPLLMRVGGREVPRSAFEYAIRQVGKDALSRDSLEKLARSFADFQLKVQAAEAKGLDTVRAFRDEMALYHARLARVYLTDTTVLSRALHRRYDRLRAQGPRIRMKQIYRRLPQNVTASSLQAAVAQMDSAYAVLQQGASFDSLVVLLSDDREEHWFYGLQVTAEMEDTLLSLRPGDYSRPFFTPRGLHIVRVLERGGVPPFAAVRDSLLRACPQCVDEAARAWAENFRQVCGFQSGRPPLSDGQVRAALFAGCDSLSRHLPAFRLALQARRDTLLAQAATRSVLEPEVPDTADLADYFEHHRSRYHWELPRYRGIVLRCTGRRVGKRVRKMLKQLPPADWMDAIRLLFNNDGVQVLAEQGTFAPGQNPYVDEQVFRRGKAPEPPGYPYVVLVGRKLKGPDDYREVSDALVADYRADQEAHWIHALRASVKVEINQEVLKTVNKQ